MQRKIQSVFTGITKQCMLVMPKGEYLAGQLPTSLDELWLTTGWKMMVWRLVYSVALGSLSLRGGIIAETVDDCFVLSRSWSIFGAVFVRLLIHKLLTCNSYDNLQILFFLIFMIEWLSQKTGLYVKFPLLPKVLHTCQSKYWYLRHVSKRNHFS